MNYDEIIKESNISDWSMGGNCFSAAQALKETLFPSGEIVMSVNEALYKKGHLVGHCYIKSEGKYYDGEGEKPIDEMESWAMLDEQDLDYIEQSGLSEKAWAKAAYKIKTLHPTDSQLKSLVDIAVVNKIKRALRKVIIKSSGA